MVPDTVRAEIAVKAEGVALLASAPWIVARSAADAAACRSLRDRQLGPGEAEAIALALELKADRLLMYDAAHVVTSSRRTSWRRRPAPRRITATGCSVTHTLLLERIGASARDWPASW